MLNMVAPEANHVKRRAQICQNHEFVVGGSLGGTYSQPKDFFKFELNSLTSLALESLKRVWEVSRGSLEVSGRSLGSLWEVSGRSLGGFWEVSGRSLGGRVSRRLQKVLDSKSDAIHNENAKILPKLVTLPYVFEGQGHFML